MKDQKDSNPANRKKISLQITIKLWTTPRIKRQEQKRE
jgi:hypothetical protein